MHNRISAFASLMVISLLIGGCGTTRGKTAGCGEAVNTVRSSARFQAVVYELAVSPQEVVALDAETLAGEADLAQALAELGEVRVLYAVDQRIDVAGDRVAVNARAPLVRSSRRTEGGAIVNSVSFEDVGVLFDIKGTPVTADRLDLGVNIELATLDESGIEIASGMQAPAVRNSVMRMQGPITLGQPVVLISADAASVNSNGQALAHIVQLVLGRPE